MKKQILQSILSFFFIVNGLSALAVDINGKLLSSEWNAQWISYPTGTGLDFEVLHFRKNIELQTVPHQFIIHVSADNRYRLFVNGNPVCFGPARGDLKHWYFESVDIAKYLKPGNNLLAAVIWNYAKDKPGAQISLRTAFILQGNSELEEVANTDNSWKVYRNDSYSPYPVTNLGGAYYAAGACDKVNGNNYPWGWETNNFDDSGWIDSKTISHGQPIAGVDSNWILIPRDIPMLEEKEIRFGKIVRSENIDVSDNFLKGNEPLTISPNTKISLLLDQEQLTIAYPELIVSGGKGSKITITYAEGLVDGSDKRNRNRVEGMKILGYRDYFEPDGGINRSFRPLWYRTYRYVQIDIETLENELTLNDYKATFTAYPFEQNASFKSDNPTLDKIWDIGWRTARLCAFETYSDCPYYEQLQYIGDTRIQALISMYVSGDDRLVRKALKLFEWSKIPEGITESRYPANELQIIPTYSLFWVSMMHDYWMLRGDSTFLSSFTGSIEDVLKWYEAKIDPKTNMLGYVPYWNFVDWASPWGWNGTLGMGGYPPGALEGGSSILTLQFAYTMDQAAELYRALGKNDQANYWESKSKILKDATYNLCFKQDKMLMADDLKPVSYSQHANIMGILSGAIPVEQQQKVMKNILENKTLIQTTFYYKFYLTRALKKTGMASNYISQLKPWEKMVNLGLSTFAETPEPTRSDCHAWSASPNYDFLATICGIEPASPGFKTIKVEPSLGDLSYIRGTMPHPNGIITVSLDKNSDESLEGFVTLPSGTSGIYRWKDRDFALVEGKNTIKPFPEFKEAHIIDNAQTVLLMLTQAVSGPIDKGGFHVSGSENNPFQINKIEINPLNNNQLILQLNEQIQITDHLKISCTDSTIASKDGFKLILFSDKQVDNLLSGSSPVLKNSQTELDGKSIVLTFNKPLSASNLDGFKLEKASGNFLEMPITAYSLKNDDQTKMLLTVNEPVFATDQLVISYSGNSVKSTDNGLLEPIERNQVINLINPSSPKIEAANLLNPGKTIEVKFNKEMNDAFNNLTDFELKANNIPILIKFNTTNVNTVLFIPQFPLKYDDIITISYKPGNCTSTDGALLEPINNYPVKNSVIQQVYKVPGQIEAENYDKQSGTIMEISKDIGGGIQMGSLDSGDWIEYKINTTRSGYFPFSCRVSGKSNPGEIIIQSSDGAYHDLDTMKIPGVANTQSWLEVNGIVMLKKGIQTIRFFVLKGENEINWIKFGNPSATNTLSIEDIDEMKIYPNPCNESVTISLQNNQRRIEIEIHDLSGKTVLSKAINNSKEVDVNTSRLNNGIYLLKVNAKNINKTTKLTILH